MLAIFYFLFRLLAIVIIGFLKIRTTAFYSTLDAIIDINAKKHVTFVT